MRNILYTAFVAVLMFEGIEGMKEQVHFVDWKKVQFATEKIDENLVKDAEESAYNYVVSNKIKKQKKLIVKAINEAGLRCSWSANGSIGDYRSYSIKIAKMLLNIINEKGKKSDLDIQKLKVVIEGLIDGNVKYSNNLSSKDFTKLGVSEIILSNIGIWN